MSIGACYNVKLFSRVLKDRLLYVSTFYKRGARVSSYVKYQKENGSKFGNVECFVRVCSCSDPCTCQVQYFAIIKPLAVSVFQVGNIQLSHMFKFQSNNDICEVNSCDVVHVQDLSTVLFKIDGTEISFLSQPLNSFELE